MKFFLGKYAYGLVLVIVFLLAGHERENRDISFLISFSKLILMIAMLLFVM